MITKKIKYKGCHPDIKKALKKGKMIKCYVSDIAVDTNSSSIWIIAYSFKNGDRPYIANYCVEWKYAIPVEEK